jgi:hypothetical protein
MVLVDDVSVMPGVPLLALSSSFSFSKDDPDQQASTSAAQAVSLPPGVEHWSGEVALSMASYNTSVAAWEPVVEAVKQDGRFAQPWTMGLKIAQQPQHIPSTKPATSVLLSTDKPLELTVSTSMLTSVLNSAFLVEPQSAALSSRGSLVFEPTPVLPEETDIGFPDMIIRNCLNQRVKLCYGVIYDASSNVVRHLNRFEHAYLCNLCPFYCLTRLVFAQLELNEGANLPLNFHSTVSSRSALHMAKQTNTRPRKHLSLLVEGAKAPLLAIPVDLVSMHVLMYQARPHMCCGAVRCAVLHGGRSNGFPHCH